VRDLLLGREPKDFDIVTNATPGQLKKLFRNCRIIGRRFRLAHLHFHDEIIEVSTFRSSAVDDPGHGDDTEPPAAGFCPPTDLSRHRSPRIVKTEDGMLLRDNVFGTPEEDALRRDFTVNAMFYSIVDFSIIDYAGGMADINSGRIHTIGDPVTRFTEDPVRMLRAVRFAAMLGFEIAPDTHKAILDLHDNIIKASPPRLYEEILKLFLAGAAEKTYQMLRHTGLFAALFPHFSVWLDSRKEGIYHTWTTKAFDLIDNHAVQGEKLSPALLIALVFGLYLEEKSAGYRHSGLSPQQAVASAVAELLGETAATVQIPQRVALQVREILVMQLRFRKTPGKQAHTFIGRHSFADALCYLRFATAIRAKEEHLAPWWDNFVRENPAVAREEVVDVEPPKSRPRRRRRRVKKVIAS
jgi:poly(A) polymerase